MTSHPTGCAQEVHRQIEYVRSQGPIANGPKRVLVIGSSAGYGLASRIVAAFGCGAGTVGVAYEKPGSEKRPGTSGWYNMQAFDREAQAAGLRSVTINDDAFSAATKQETIAKIRDTLGQVDLVVYSLASPVRTDPATGETYRSVLKPIGAPYTATSADPMSGEVKQTTIEPASEDEIAATVKVMGGDDWQLWIDALLDAGVLADGARTVAYSYIGPEATRQIYREGTIGRAKEHLERTAIAMDAMLRKRIGGGAWVSVNKALVTRASAVIPVVSLYISLLYKVMKEKGLHEGCIEQIYRLFTDRLYAGGEVPTDESHRIRIDDLEMHPDVQEAVDSRWGTVTTDNISSLSDIAGFRQEFLRLHGFEVPGVDYTAEVEP